MNLFDIESAYIARLQAAAPAGVTIADSFDATDWTADDAPCVGMHVTLDSLPGDDVRTAALMQLGFSVHTYLATRRATPADKATAQACVLAAIRAALGWEWRPGLAARITDAQGIGFDGRTARLTISFTVPAPVAGIA